LAKLRSDEKNVIETETVVRETGGRKIGKDWWLMFMEEV